MPAPKKFSRFGDVNTAALKILRSLPSVINLCSLAALRSKRGQPTPLALNIQINFLRSQRSKKPGKQPPRWVARSAKRSTSLPLFDASRLCAKKTPLNQFYSRGGRATGKSKAPAAADSDMAAFLAVCIFQTA